MSEFIGNLDQDNIKSQVYYYVSQFETFAKEVLIDALPGTLLLKTCTTAFLELFPSLYYNIDDLDDPEGVDYIVTPENKGILAKKILEQRVSFDPSIPESTRSSQMSSLYNLFLQGLSNRLSQVASLGQRMGIMRPIHYSISLGETFHSSYCAVGDRFSVQDPVINAAIPAIRIANSEITIASPTDTSTVETIRAFVIMHELAHIARGDYLVRLVTLAAMSVVNTLLWVHGLGLAAPLATRLITTGVTSILTHTVARLFYFALARHQEWAADRLAMNTLGSSEGAQILFSSLQNNPSDLGHPTVTDRLAFARTWSAGQ